jgi:hypothetical protein
VGDGPKAGRPVRYDQPMAEGSRSHICQRTVGENPLPGYGPVILSNRPVRTRMPGGVGAGGERPPATRLEIRLLVKHCLQLCPMSRVDPSGGSVSVLLNYMRYSKHRSE